VPADEAAALYPYGRSNSPVVVGDRLIVAPGGVPGGRIASLAALDKTTGETLWQAGDHQISMATPALATLGGVEQILLVNEDFVTGHDLVDGRVLWQLELPGKTSSNANVSNAVGIAPNRVFVSKGYGIGSALWELADTPSNGLPWTATPVWQSARTLRTKFTNVVVRGDHVYGLSEGVLECVELGTGERTWKGGRYGHGQILLVGEVIVVLSEDGEIFYVEASPERGNNVLASFEAIDGQTWNPFAIAGDLLLVRNSDEAAAYRLPTRR
jgi:outer membrane protein assembly factor BamB